MTHLVPGRPDSSEYAPFYAGYVAGVPGDDILAVLESQRASTLALFRSVSEEQGAFRYAPGKWSMKEVLGHLIDGERVFAYRALSIARGETQSLPGFDQDAYVEVARFDARTLASLVEEYETVRSASSSLFGSFDAEVWLRQGTANGKTVSVRALAFVIGGHEAHHVRVLQERYLSR